MINVFIAVYVANVYGQHLIYGLDFTFQERSLP